MANFSSMAAMRIISAIRAQVPNFNRCPVCGTNHWTLANGLVSMPFHPFAPMDLPAWLGSVVGSSGTVGTEEMQAYALVCDKCAYVQLFSASGLGYPHYPPLTAPPLPKPGF